MNPQTADAIFLKVNKVLGSIPAAAIAAAQKKQVEDMMSGRPPRPLPVILREQGILTPAIEATLKPYLEGKEPIPAEAPPDEPSELFMKAHHSLLEMEKPTVPAEDPEAPADPSKVPGSLLNMLPQLSEHQELEVAQRAVRRGMISAEQLRECLGKQLDDITKFRRKPDPKASPEAKARPKRSLLAILVEKGYLNMNKVDDLLNEPTRHFDPPPGR